MPTHMDMQMESINIHKPINLRAESDEALRYIAHIDKDAHHELIRRNQLQHFNSSDPDESWQQAWNFCRRQGRAVTVIINGERWALSPDGEAWKIGVAA